MHNGSSVPEASSLSSLLSYNSLLEIDYEEESLAKLNVAHNCMCQTVTYLLHVDKAKCFCNFL